MRVVAADRAAGRPHRDRGQVHAFVSAQIADHVPVIGMQRGLAVDVEGVAVLHQELAPPHHAKARPQLVTEFPLDMIQRQRQVLVAGDMRAKDVGDHLFVGGTIQQLALLAVGDPQHFLAVIAIAA